MNSQNTHKIESNMSEHFLPTQYERSLGFQDGHKCREKKGGEYPEDDVISMSEPFWLTTARFYLLRRWEFPQGTETSNASNHAEDDVMNVIKFYLQ